MGRRCETEASTSCQSIFNGMPRGTKTAHKGDEGLFKEVKLNRGRPMAPASQDACSFCRARQACAFLSCFHSFASASQYAASANSFSFLASVACSRHMISNTANSSVEYIELPVGCPSLTCSF
jgi:hypothetical protein